MNYMEQVAKMLGVELEEEFKVSNYNEAFKITKYGMENFSDFSAKWDFANNILVGILTGHYEIKKPILDDVEKEYLSNVIKPFRDKVKCIVKRDYEMSYGNEYIFIVFNDDGCMQIKMCFPSFKKGTMYKGMETGKKYTFEELGLWAWKIK